jgi:hypothetical protein
MKTVSPWPFQPAAVDGEIFSSYLARLASIHGLSPYRFFSFYFPGIAVWNRDIDRYASDTFIRDIAHRLHRNPEDIFTMTLRPFERAMTGLDAVGQGKRSGISPWINAAGIFHRTRKSYGTQYCPLCLTRDMAYKTTWRLSFVTVCAIHHCTLLDCCPHCGSPVVFHRNDSFSDGCHACGRLLIQFMHEQSDDKVLDARLALQKILLNAAQSGYANLAGRTVVSSEFFTGLSILLKGLKAKFRVNRQHFPTISSPYLDLPGGRIELLRIDGRSRYCLLIAEVLGRWPDQFLEIAQSHKITKATFQDALNVPTWLSQTLETLPEGMRRYRPTSAAPSIRNTLRELHRNKKHEWRMQRAKLLLKAAKVRQ